MGGYLSTFSRLIWAKKEIRILILGLVRRFVLLRPEIEVTNSLVGQCWQDDTSLQT